MLTGAGEDQRQAALDSENATGLPWVADALRRVADALTDLLPRSAAGD